ncbi:MAG TPA: OmpA family protein [Myxococcota bacterium]|nr:OmpA family protein [Myxococcota bacterium]
MRATRVLALALIGCLLSSCATLQSIGPATCGVIGSAIGGAGGALAGVELGQNGSAGPGILGGVLGFAGGAVAGYFLCRKPKAPPKQVAQAAPAKPPEPAKPDPCKEKVSLPGVNFDFAKATIRPDGEKVLGEWEARLEQCTDVHVAVHGFTDSIGSEAYNLKLSQRRADSVRDFLVKRGIAASRLETKGFGKADPVASNDTAEGRAQNRRVELIPAS